MKAVQIENGKPVIASIPRPTGDGVVVKIASASICGTDLHMLSRGALEGVVPGHEFAGYTGDGTAVAIEPIYGCGHCSYCDDGYNNHCEHGSTLIGAKVDGGMAEYVEVPAKSLYELPSGLDIQDATLIEPLAVAVHGLNQGEAKPGDKILVIGAGAVGIATAAALHAKGLPFDITARYAHQEAAAVKLGANFEVSDGYDLVFDAVGTKDSISESVKRLRPRGRLIALGCFWNPVPLSMAFCAKEITAIASVAYKCQQPDRSFEEAGKMLHANPHIADAMVTHNFPLDAAEEAFACASDKSSGSIKVRFLI